MPICPLCHKSYVKLKKRLDLDRMIDSWKKRFNIDIRTELAGVSKIFQYYCPACRLGFFDPAPIASGDLYDQLSREPWYYDSNKWEFQEALKDLVNVQRVLEIGSGRGEFVAKLHDLRVEVIGLELNNEAVKEAQRLGRPVFSQQLDSLIGKFDAICCFQVLEHVDGVREFIANLIQYLNPGGHLLIAVPNNKSYIKYEYNPLNLPPHHVTHWNADSLKSITNHFPIRLERIAYEPLSEQSLRLVADAYINKLPAIPGFIGFVYRLSRLAISLCGPLKVWRLWNGHSVYAKYVLSASSQVL